MGIDIFKAQITTQFLHSYNEGTTNGDFALNIDNIICKIFKNGNTDKNLFQGEMTKGFSG